MLRRKCLVSLIVLLLAVGPATAGLQVVFGPTLGDLTPNSAQLSWFTNLPSIGYVEINNHQVGQGGPARAHKVKLSGLQPDTVYEYKLVAIAGEQTATAGPYRLRTPPEQLAQWSFCAYGDTRTQADAHRRVTLAMKACLPRLILHTGDLVADGREMSDWHSFFPIIRLFAPSTPFYPCLGNHEQNAELYYQLLPLPAGYGDYDSEWYTFVFGNCQFIVLDSSRSIPEQTEWLREVLSKPLPEGVDWRLASFHHPPFSSGPHGGSEELQTQWCPLLEEGGVSLVFSGHDHMYERSLHEGLTYITVGNGGAPLYETGQSDNPYSQFAASVYGFCQIRVTPQRLHVTARTDKLGTIDQVTITR